MSESTNIEDFWQQFCRANPEINPKTKYDFWCFGNTAEMAKRLGKLVLKGDKRATTTLLESAQKEGYEPSVGDYTVITDFEGSPIGVIQITEIKVLPFDKVDEEYALVEGEGDKSLDYWREGHRRFFTIDAAEYGVEFSEKSLVICQKFNLLYPNK
jgi:uncharacterized protein YhfF